MEAPPPPSILEVILHSGPVIILAHLCMVAMFVLLLVQIVRLYIHPRPIAEACRWLVLLPLPAVIGIAITSFGGIAFFGDWSAACILDNSPLIELPRICGAAVTGTSMAILLYVTACPLVLISPAARPGVDNE